MIDTLKQKAEELGLAAVGIAPAIDDVKNAFGWARSVVCVAISYLPPERKPPDDAPRGVVARCARSADYHLVLREKLARLAEVITRQHPAARVEVCVDTCPLPERKLAVLAGIAWRGRNGCVFVEGCGSWVALGEIVTDLPYAAGTASDPGSENAQALSSRSILDLCGDCTRCIDACPTGAIIAPHEIDRRRCISALTQAGGEIAPDLRAAMGNRIYGCDVCQEVCPHNAGIEPVTPEFAVNVFPGAYPELMPLVDLTAEGFREYVAGSSIGWIRRTRIRRNASIAAENLKREDNR